MPDKAQPEGLIYRTEAERELGEGRSFYNSQHIGEEYGETPIVRIVSAQ